MSVLSVLLTLAIFVIVVLSCVAGYYLFKVRSLRATKRNRLEQMKYERTQQKIRLNKSIQIIAQCMLDDQLSLTEGSIRISVLLEGLNIDESVRDSFVAFFHLAAATNHIPILEQWKLLSNKEQRLYNREREKLEKDHREFVLDAAGRIRNCEF